jgi:hypothetical protein
MAELGIGIVSACLPTMRPIFVKTMFRFGSSSKGSGQEVAEVPNISDPALNLTVQQQRSNPALSKAFRHIGVLGDLEPGAEHQSNVENTRSGFIDWRIGPMAT